MKKHLMVRIINNLIDLDKRIGNISKIEDEAQKASEEKGEKLPTIGVK